MSSLFRRVVSIAAVTSALMPLSLQAQTRELKVCADPDNLPYSNSKQQGFENRIAEVIARDMGMRARFVWARMGRGFVRSYINTGDCDLMPAVPQSFRQALTTDPYYRSTFVFVTRKGAPVIRSFDDPALRNMKIGVQVLEEDYAPPARALSRRHLTNNIVGFETTGDEAGDIVRAVLKKRIDVAVVWGPLAGYFSRTHRADLTLTPVEPEIDPPALPFTFAISMAVKKGNTELQQKVNSALQHKHAQIQSILASYGVPRLPLAESFSSSGGGK